MADGCNNHKDMSLCRAAAKFHPLEQRHFYTVYLWETEDAMRAAAADNEGEYSAITTHMPYYESESGKLTFTPKLGEIHLVARKWDQEIIAHECLHASFGLARAHGVSSEACFDGSGELSGHFKGEYGVDDGIISDEELVCYMHGQLVDAVTKWLWKHDPSEKWQRLEVAA